LFWPP
jgi:hypothetical protein